jgi:hypothetical protein
VGVATGTFMDKLTEKWFDITGLELNNSAVAVCKGKGLKVYNELLNNMLNKTVTGMM